MVSEVRAEINFSKYLKISQSILDKCINALGVYSEEDLQIRKEILNSINEIWAIFNETLPDNFFEIFPPSVSSIIILVKLCTLIFNNMDREVDAENKLEACKLLDKHVELLDASHRERSINLSVELKTQTLISALMINEDINEIIEQIFDFNEIFNEKNSVRIEEIYIQNDLITLRKKFPFELFEIDFISYIIYFINNYSNIFEDQKGTQLGKIEWNHPATDEIKYRLKYGHGKIEGKEESAENEKEAAKGEKDEKKTSETDGKKDKDMEIEESKKSEEDDSKSKESDDSEQPKKKTRKRRKRADKEDDSEKDADKAKTKGKAAKGKKISSKDDIKSESTSTDIGSSGSDRIELKTGPTGEIIEVPKQKRHTKKRWNEEQEKFLEECIKNNSFVIEPKKFYDEHGPNGTISHKLADFTVNNIRDKCKSEKRKRIKLNMNLGVYANAINNSYHIQMEIQNELVSHKRVPNCRRRRWTEEQLKCLEKCILENNGNIYPSLILNLHGPNGIQSNILGNQTRQSIHDKCKNEKWKRIQQGLPLGAFENAAKKSLSSIGNKWKNTKVLKEYVACSDGKRRKRNIDPYYKSDQLKKGRKRKDGEDESEASSSNATSQSQSNIDSGSNNFSIGYNTSMIPEVYNNFSNNDSSTNNSFIHINDTNTELSGESSNFISNSNYDQNARTENAFPFIPTNDSVTNTTGNDPNVYIKANVNNPVYDNTTAANTTTTTTNDKTESDNIPSKTSYETANPFQFSEKETSDYYFQQDHTKDKITDDQFKDTKNDENNNNINNRAEVKISPVKPITEPEFFKSEIATE